MLVPQAYDKGSETKQPIAIYFDVQSLTPSIPANNAISSQTIVDHPLRPATKVISQSKDPNISGNYGGYCVAFAKRYLGLSGTWGYGGRYLPANDPEPQIHDVVLFGNYHVAVIIGITADGTLILIESNYHLDKRITLGRQVSISDPTIRGFYHPVEN